MVDSTAPILVPLDGTRSAERVLPLVRDIATAFGNPVVLLQAGDPLLLAEGPCGMELAPGGAASYWRAESEAYLREKEAELTEFGLPVTSINTLGLPAAVILATAQEYRAGLIILASHGRGWLGRLVLGGVTTRVLNQSETPVLVVRQCAPELVENVQTERKLVGAGHTERR
jgi:nucleotide-binding universal stress UspA family protein